MQEKNGSYKGIYTTAVLGAVTAKGGRVTTASSGSTVHSLPVARVGDKVVYPDGAEATITSGCGILELSEHIPLALVGSHVSGGDRIVSNPELYPQLVINDDDERPEGFLTEGWTYQGK